MDKWRANKAPTHLCMNGGMLHVPEEQLHEFFTRYVEAVTVGKLYLVEKITSRFRFFLDLDWVGQAPNLKELKVQLTDAIGSAPLLAVTPPKAKGDQMKYGIHAHWPDLIVSRPKALQLRERLPPEVREYADASVYSTGLRMLWSHKKDESLPYVPVSADLVPLTAPDARALKKYSIRVASATPEPVAPGGALLEFVRKYLPGQSEASFKNRTKNKRGTLISVKTDSKYCERIGKEHRSNHVFFEVDLVRKTVCQKCFDEDCHGFAGKRYILSPSVLNEMASHAHDDCAFVADD